MKEHKHVLIALGWYDHRLHRGIERYAQEHDWYLSANPAREKVIPWGWQGDGILAWLGPSDELAEFVECQERPTVDFSFRRPELPLPRVLEDHKAAAELVAEHFLARGFAHFMFYSDAPDWSHEERGSGFVAALEQRGCSCTWIKWQESPESRNSSGLWKRKHAWLAAQLKQVPKPLALFAASDQLALDALESCKSAGLAVPDQVAIVGAENCLLAPDTMETPISSVDTNLELLGYRGASLLDDCMSGKASPAEPVRIPPAGLIVRKSSDLLAVEHKGVARSLRYMHEHFHEPITIKDVVGIASMSRRGLHKAFVQVLGRTPGAELHELRIQKAKRLLCETSHKIHSVAEMCGFQSANTFCISFRHTVRTSPGRFRAKMLLQPQL
ncbi:MAG: DNA-binding transcriptional regulator [Verrucomicrobia bacterium]|nr:DNA-binding transcriptional regulator [Verrucomicrobiota bacterium]